MMNENNELKDPHVVETFGDIEQTLKVRNGRYGDFSDNACVSQEIKRAFKIDTNWEMLDHDQQEALELIAMKISRILTGDPNYSDNWHDIAGYATIIEKRNRELDG